jgi:hypothetical protein
LVTEIPVAGAFILDHFYLLAAEVAQVLRPSQVQEVQMQVVTVVQVEQTQLLEQTISGPVVVVVAYGTEMLVAMAALAAQAAQ